MNRRQFLSVFSFIVIIIFFSLLSIAESAQIKQEHQACQTDSDCVVISTDCHAPSCSRVPVNREYAKGYVEIFEAPCKKESLTVHSDCFGEDFVPACHQGKCVDVKPYVYFSFLYSLKSQPLVKVKVNGVDYIISRAIYETSSFFDDYRKNNEGISEVTSSEENIWKASIDELISLCYMASSFGGERCDQNDGNFILYFDESYKRWLFKTKLFLIEINKRGIVIQSKIFQGGKYISLAGQSSGETPGK